LSRKIHAREKDEPCTVLVAPGDSAETGATMKRFSHRAALLFLLVAASSASAAQPASPGASSGAAPDFAQHKQRELARIAERIQALQSLQSCVQAAADHAAVRTCNETAHDQMKRHPG
jgi:hypothetical protein